MPEGHSIRRLADQWDRYVGASFALSSPQGRFAAEAAALTPAKLVSTDAHGKHLFLEFEHGQYIHVHLGLYGRFRWHRTTTPPPVKGEVRLRAVTDNVTVDLSGPTVCEVLDSAGKQRIHDRLGIDPLRDTDTIEPLLPWLNKSTWPVGKTLMDQAKIAGIGNVYRAEILFMLGMNPQRETSTVSNDEWRQLWTLARTLLRAGVEQGRIITTSRTLPPPVTLPPGTQCADRTYVYKRTEKPCVACGTAVQEAELASRTLYWCPTCQA